MGKKRKRPVKDDRTGEESGQHQPSKCSSRPPRADGSLAPNVAGSSHPVISLYYRQVVTLRQYILQRIPRSSKARRRKIAAVRSDDAEIPSTDHGKCLADLLDTTLVGIWEEISPTRSQERRRDFIAYTQTQRVTQMNTDIGPQCLQSEIVDFIISSLFTRGGISYQRPEHLLSHGFRHPSDSHNKHRLPCSIFGIEANYPNKNVQMLKQAPWTEVLPLLGSNGDEIMLKLLLDCGLFMPVDANKRVYCQISGLPLSNLEPIRTLCREDDKEGRPQDAKINSRTGSTKIRETNNQHGLNAIVFYRAPILYARPHFTAKGEIEFGLPNHVLNRVPSSQSLQETVHMLKYIFPRQFGLHNVFTIQPNSRENGLYKNYSSREDEIARNEKLKLMRFQQVTSAPDSVGVKQQKSVKMPKRLRGRAVELVRQLQNRNKRCCYQELLRYYCPQQCSGPWTLGPLSSESEISATGTAASGSGRLITQPPIADQAVKSMPQPGNAPSTVGNGGPSTGKGVSKPKVNLTDYATPAASVSAFCRAVIRKLIPPDFFGLGEQGTIHRKITLGHVNRFVHMRRYENLSLDEVCRGIKITQIPWLEPQSLSQASSQNKVSMSDRQKRTELFHEFLYYLFDSILVPLIRGNFYVTESQVNRNRLFYFRHDVWRRIIAQPLANLKSSMFEELTPKSAHDTLVSDRKRLLGCGSLRLLPKTTGIRPIVNLKRRTLVQSTWDGETKSKSWTSVNAAIAPTHSMLNYEKGRRGDMLGSSMCSVGDIHPRLKAFKGSLMQKGWGPETPLYFVKLDITSCFDTIPQEKLVRLIEKLVSGEAYHYTKYVEMRPGNKLGGMWPSRGVEQSKAQRKFVHRVASMANPEPLIDAIANGNVTGKKHAVFIDTIKQKGHDGEALLDLLNEHVRKNLVKIGKKYFRQRNGIPQGSAMSSLLCNLFYAEMERDVLGFLQSADSLLLRLVDDFLLVTLDCELAMQFLRVMIRGQPAYGISVNPAKSLVNFAASVDGIQIPRLVDTPLFPYCGSLIDTRTLGIFKDQDRILDGAESVTAALTNSLTVESTRVPGRSFHRKVLASVKQAMHPMYLDTAHNSHAVVLSNLYAALITASMKMYRYTRLLPGRTHPRPEVVMRTIRDVIELGCQLIRGRDGVCTVTYGQMRYLGAAAFRFVLGRKQTRYADVLRWLDGTLRDARRNPAALLVAVVQKGNLTYGGWRF